MQWNLKMNLKQLRYFVAVAEEKQISAAAKRLLIAQPPLSYQLKQLEKELGVKLFTRTAHGIILTDEGKKLQVYAERIISLADIAKDQVTKISKGELGTIRLGVVSSSTGELPTESFKKITKYYPNIAFDIYEENTFGVLEKLHNRTIDLGLVRTPFNHYGFEHKTITNEKMMAVTTDLDILNQGKITIKELSSSPLIIYRRFEDIFTSTFANQGLKPYFAVKCDDARTAILWSQKGMGIALVPESIAKLYANGQSIPVAYAAWNTHLQLIWPKEKSSLLLDKIIDLF